MAGTPGKAMELWNRFEASRSVDDRNAIVTHYLPQARVQARRKDKRTPVSVSFDELQSAAQLGVIQAVESYKSGTGVPLGAYVSMKVEFAMADWMREADMSPRQSGAMSPRVTSQDPAILDAETTEEEAVSLDGWCGRDLEVGEFNLSESIEQLPSVLQTLLTLHYGAGLCLEQVAGVMGISKESASLKHREAVYRLKLIAVGIEWEG